MVDDVSVLRNTSAIQVSFHVSGRPGRRVFFDLDIEGINVLRSGRSEIGAMLGARGGDLDALIRDLV